MTNIPDKVQILERKRTYDGWLKVDQLQLSFERFDGSMSEPVTREVVDRNHAVALLPYDPRTGKVLMIRQFLTGAHEAGVPAWPLQTISGVIDEGETPEQAALREAREEAGLDIDPTFIRKGPVYLVSPGAFTETIHVFHAFTSLSEDGGVFGVDDESENIRTELIDLEDALAEIKNGKVLPSLAVVALMDLKLTLMTRNGA